MTNPVLDALRETTVMACVATRALGLRRTDKSASEQISIDKNAVSKAANVQVNRLAGADSLHKNIISLQHEASDMLKRNSQPYGDEDKWRLLPNARFQHFIEKVAPIKQAYDVEIDKLRQLAPGILEEARKNIGSFDVQLPSVEEMVNSYDLRTEFQPIPDGRNFQGLSDNTIEKLRDMHDRRVVEAVEKAQANTLERFVEPVKRFIDRMQAYDQRLAEQAKNPDAEKSMAGIFRDSVITNIQDLHGVLDSFNITGDPRLTQLGNLLEPLKGLEAKHLRASDSAREKATARAQEVLDNLNSWL